MLSIDHSHLHQPDLIMELWFHILSEEMSRQTRQCVDENMFLSIHRYIFSKLNLNFLPGNVFFLIEKWLKTFPRYSKHPLQEVLRMSDLDVFLTHNNWVHSDIICIMFADLVNCKVQAGMRMSSAQTIVVIVILMYFYNRVILVNNNVSEKVWECAKSRVEYVKLTILYKHSRNVSLFCTRALVNSHAPPSDRRKLSRDNSQRSHDLHLQLPDIVKVSTFRSLGITW